MFESVIVIFFLFLLFVRVGCGHGNRSRSYNNHYDDDNDDDNIDIGIERKKILHDISYIWLLKYILVHMNIHIIWHYYIRCTLLFSMKNTDFTSFSERDKKHTQRYMCVWAVRGTRKLATILNSWEKFQYYLSTMYHMHMEG